MKNIIVVMVGIMITIYVMFIGLNVYKIQTHKVLLEKDVSRGIEHALQEGYKSKDEEVAMAILENEILENRNRQRFLEVKSSDMAKGILSIAVTEQFHFITGKMKEIVVEKTIVMDRAEMEVPMVKVVFMLGEEVYKEYYLVRGEVCPMPKAPSTSFIGWIAKEDESQAYVVEVGEVWEDKVYTAKMR